MTLSTPESDLPSASFKTSPQDFVVDEIPAYLPRGEGDHLFVSFRKTGLTTDDAVRQIARALDVDARNAGVAGQKDKVSVSTQWASFLVGPKGDHVDRAAALALPGIEILTASRHGNKLKPGHLEGNRFTVRLRQPSDRQALERGLELARERGVPNHYGAQRFGREGDNASRALAFVRGEARPPRDKKQLRFMFSALQSALFNDVLDRRVADGTWFDILPGDLAKKHDTGGLFLVAESGPELDDARERARAGLLSATGPMFGSEMRRPEGAARAIEDASLARAGLTMDNLGAFRAAGEGTRRALRLCASEVTFSAEGEDLMVGFVLPSGGYATTFLGSVCRLIEPPRPGGSQPRPTDTATPEAEGDAPSPSES